MIWTQYGRVLYVCAKFEADSSIRLKVIRGSKNFEFGSRDPKPRLATLGSFYDPDAVGARPLYLCRI